MKTEAPPGDSAKPKLRRRLRSIAWVLVLVTVGCSGSPQPTGPLADVTLQPLPAIDEITYVTAAQAELDLIAEMRADAGLAELLGEDGEAILQSLNGAYREHGEATLPEIAEELGLDLSASLEVATAGRPPDPGPRALGAEWSGSLVGQVSGTLTMVMSLMTTVVKISDTASNSSFSKTERYTPNPGESIEITTTFRITSGGGMVNAEVEIQSTDVIKDATGAEIARLVGTGRGHIDVNGCPDASGLSEGTYSLEWEEELTGGGGSGGSSYSNTAPFNLWDGDDAHWTRIDTTMNLERGAHGSGTADGDWSVNASVPMTIPKQGRTVIGYDQGTSTNTNATPDQVDRTVNGTFGSQQFLIEVAKAAEEFWRSGKCIELRTIEESRNVDASEDISFSVDAFHEFDGGHLEAPITASFSGKETLEPANQPIDPPASFDFTAGANPGDTGTIQLKQTSRRGIGLKTLTFKVEGDDLLVTYDGRLEVTVPEGGFNGDFLMADVKLTGTGDTLTGLGPIQVTGSIVAGPCSAPVDTEVDGTVTATRDEADTNLVRVRLQVDIPMLTTMMNCPEGLTFPYPLSSTIQLWAGGLITPVDVEIGGSVTVSTQSSGTTTITVERATPS